MSAMRPRAPSLGTVLALLLAAPLAMTACEPPRAPAVAPAPPPPAPPAPPAPVVETPDAPFRAVPPRPGPDPTFVPPRIDERRLSNGIPVLVVARPEAAVSVVEIVVRRGAEAGSPGLGAFMGAMLGAGTRTRSALALSDAFEALGADWSTRTDQDSTVVRAQVLATSVEPAIELLADVVLHPAFAPAEIERERSSRLNAIAQERERAGSLLANTTTWALYPDGHPYKLSLLGTEASVQKLRRQDLVRFHARNVTPDRTTVVATGAIDVEKLLASLEKHLGRWRGRAAAAAPPAEPAPPAADAPRVIVVDRPGAPQTSVAVADVGVPRSTEDWAALSVMNAILGGKFSSRLNLNLREKHAYTYGASSSFDMRHGPGPFRAGGEIVAAHTIDAVKEILAELARIGAEPVAPEELADAKGAIVKALPARFETAGDTAGALAQLAIYGLPLDEYATRAARIEAVTAEDVRRVAAAHLVPGRLRVVLVGDAKSFRDGLAGLNLGAPLEFSATTR